MSLGIRTFSRRLRSAGRLLRGFQVPWCVPAWGWAEARASIGALSTGRLVQGDNPAPFAAAVARTLGRRYGVPVNRGRTAIDIGLRAMGIGSGDAVVMPAYVCATLLEGVVASGATAVFADVGNDLNVTASSVKAAITPATKCVIVPHLFGKAAAIEEIEELLSGTGIALFDDAAQSFGARRAGRLVGAFGVAGVVAIGAGKSLAGPAGGVLVTDDPALYANAVALVERLPAERSGAVASRLVAYWVWRRWRRVTYPIMVLWQRIVRPREEPHIAARMSNVDASIGIAQLAQLESHMAERREHAGLLTRALGPLAAWSVTDESPEGTQVKYVVVLPEAGPDAAEFADALAHAGIETQGGYSPCIGPGTDGSSLRVTNGIWRRVVCLPTETAFRNAGALASLFAKYGSAERVRADSVSEPARSVRFAVGAR